MSGPDAMRCRALVPVKPLAKAKQRLAPLLSDGERIELARAMLNDVLAALAATPGIAEIVLVTDDPEAATLAASFAARTVPDNGAPHLNDAILRGLARFEAGTDGVMIVPADVPFATADEFAAVVAALRHYPVVLSPAVADGGTNALAMRRPDTIAPQFGADSFRRHQIEAAAAGLACGIVHGDGLGRDIDRPEDLVAALGRAPTTATAKLLADLAIPRRCRLLQSSGCTP
ncbi:MAG: 2-phospho-L-lactate guanylyltransferase [Proteobacteria bacterium]|nr:MAG: 2-phospho-L-lactate guanylyltransferase [Pseudomonadota bacterium]